ncbi:hypothetical protein ACO0RG_003754 [Hanseniaspora osmophila]
MTSGTLIPDAFDESFNPNNILLSYESAYSMETQISFGELQSFFNRKMNQSIIYGTRIGAAAVAILILWMVTKNKRSPIFIINQFTLLIIVLHSALFLKYLASPYSSAIYTFTYFPQLVHRSNIYVSGAVNMLEVVLIALVEISLVYQVYTIFKSSENRKMTVAWISLSSALGLATIGTYFATAVISMLNIYEKSYSTSDSKLFNVSVILLASSINVMTLLLSLKLFFAVRARRFLGLKQFDTFHILLIMSAQSLIIPSILYILSYALPAKDGTSNLAAIATLIVVLSLPLSSMWASSTNNSSQVNTFNPNAAATYTDNGSFYSQTIQSAIEARRSTRKNFWNPAVDLSPNSEKTAKESYSNTLKKFGSSVNNNFRDEDDFTIDDKEYWTTKNKQQPDTQVSLSDIEILPEALRQLKNNNLDDDIVHYKVISKR